MSKPEIRTAEVQIAGRSRIDLEGQITKMADGGTSDV